MLDDLLICPVCHVKLPLAELRLNNVSTCSNCKYEYHYSDGAFDLIPRPFPSDDIQRKADLWEKLQENGLISYTIEPENNLSVGARKDSRVFGAFCELDGVVLDVGCGPQVFPTYAEGFKGRFVGIDPIRGEAKRNFDFAVAVGEYLPFQDQTFNQVIFAGSLDHVLNQEQVFEEVKRVLKPGGIINIWFGVPETQGTIAKLTRKAIHVGRYLLRGDFQGLAKRAQQEVNPEPAPSVPDWFAALPVPEGAVDTYHLTHLDKTSIAEGITQAGLKVTKSVHHPEFYSHFLKAVIR